jgi:hypothetical protein
MLLDACGGIAVRLRYELELLYGGFSIDAAVLQLPALEEAFVHLLYLGTGLYTHPLTFL